MDGALRGRSAHTRRLRRWALHQGRQPDAPPQSPCACNPRQKAATFAAASRSPAEHQPNQHRKEPCRRLLPRDRAPETRRPSARRRERRRCCLHRSCRLLYGILCLHFETCFEKACGERMFHVKHRGLGGRVVRFIAMRRRGRVVEGGSLENCYAERHRGFESYRLRHIDSLNPMQAFYVLAVFQIAGQGSVDVRKGSAEEDQQTGLCGKCSAEKPAIVFRHHRPPCSRSTSSRLAEPATRTCIVEPRGARGSTRFRIPSKNYRSFIGT